MGGENVVHCYLIILPPLILQIQSSFVTSLTTTIKKETNITDRPNKTTATQHKYNVMLTLDERRALGLSDAAIGVPSANKTTSKEVKKSSRRRLRRRQRKPNQTKLAQQSVKSAMAPAKRNDWMDSIVEKVSSYL